jgi:hypothetical protein
MAKKKAGVWEKRPAGRPSRECENCHKFYFPRYKECPACGAANPSMTGVSRRKVKRRTVRKAASRRGAGTRTDALDAAIDFIRTAGGVDNARAALDRIDRIRKL